jgi:hypothetical protein
MPRKKRSTRRIPEPLTRFTDISAVRAGVSVGVVQEGRGEPFASTHGSLSGFDSAPQLTGRP